jgi:hypothetical protein
MTNAYRFDLEDRQYLKHCQNESPILAMRGTYNEIRLDAKQILQVESQASQGACAGHSLSSILEWCYAIATGGERLQLSRAMAYYEAQRIDNIRGDNGSTISAGVKLSKLVGLCVESLWKYPERYNSARPANWAEITEDAAKHKIGTEIRITSYDGYRTFLGAGIGGVHGGWNWNDTMNKKVVETFQPTNRDGGHSEAGICLSTRVDSKDRPYVWILGSWGRNFAQSGWQEFSPTCIQQMLQHPNTALVGLSDMVDIKPRKFTVEEWQNALRI